MEKSPIRLAKPVWQHQTGQLANSDHTGRLSTIGGLDWWTGLVDWTSYWTDRFSPLDWTTGLTFDPIILVRNSHFAPRIGSARMLSSPFSGPEGINFTCYQA